MTFSTSDIWTVVGFHYLMSKSLYRGSAFKATWK